MGDCIIGESAPWRKYTMTSTPRSASFYFHQTQATAYSSYHTRWATQPILK